MFVGGPNVEQFEQDFAKFTGAVHCVGVSSGTDALRFALIAAGVGNEDIVVTVANTFAATVEAIVQAGATAQFVDIDSRTFNMSVGVPARNSWHSAVRSTSRGTVARASKQREDCQSDHAGAPLRTDVRHGFDHGNWRRVWITGIRGRLPGTWQPSTFRPETTRGKKRGQSEKPRLSVFIPGKTLGPAVKAGAVTTNDEDLARRIRMIRDHGQSKKYHHQMEGYNGRLDAMQAALLAGQVALP